MDQAAQIMCRFTTVLNFRSSALLSTATVTRETRRKQQALYTGAVADCNNTTRSSRQNIGRKSSEISSSLPLMKRIDSSSRRTNYVALKIALEEGQGRLRKKRACLGYLMTYTIHFIRECIRVYSPSS